MVLSNIVQMNSLHEQISYRLLAVVDLRGRRGRTPLWGPNSFNFMQILGNFGKIICWPAPGSWRSLLGEILDPPLVGSKNID